MITTQVSKSSHARSVHDDRGRIPFELPVELAHEGWDDDAFEADGVDLSSGGMSLRSACLPGIGEQLKCRFEALPDGTRIERRAEVVWTHADGERSGEFGLRFLDADSEQRFLLDELLSERRAERAREARDGAQHEQGARELVDDLRIAELELAGVGAPLPTRLLRTGGGEAVFEQRMDLLELGRGVIARAGAVLGKGNIANVSLRMDGETPTLAVTVRFEDGKSLFGEFDWEAPSTAIKESDTVPDLDAPAGSHDDQVEAVSHTTMMEFEAAREPNPAQASSASPAALADADADMNGADSREELAARQAESEEDDTNEDDTNEDDTNEDAANEDATNEDVRLAAQQEVAPKIVAAPVAARSATPNDGPVIHAPPAKPRLQVEDDDTWAHPLPEARSSALVRFLRILVAIGNALQSGGKVALRTFGPKLQAALVTVLAKLGALARSAAPMVQSAVQGVFTKTLARPRRTTTAPATVRKVEQEGRGIVRLAVISVLAVCAIALGVYALAPSGDDSVPVHRKAKRSRNPSVEAPVQEPSAANGAQPAELAPNAADLSGAAPPSAAAPSAAPGSKVNPAYASAMLGRPAPGAAQPSTAIVDSHAVPAGSPYAVDVRDSAHRGATVAVASPATKVTVSTTAPAKVTTTTTAGSPSFGAKNVTNPARFVLRMTAAVKTLQGSSDRTGFTVMIPGALSLDKASPIAANHKSVARAMVRNRGDHAELSVYFAEGKSPAFRVTGRGAELEVLLAQ